MTNPEKHLESAPKDTVRSSWVHRFAPAATVPYLQLMRADRPIGTWLLLWPCLWSIALASHWQYWRPENWEFYLPHISYLILFSIGAYVMRGAGCVVNDLADIKFDAQVERTRERPLPSGRVSVKQALLFLGGLCLLGLLILLQFNVMVVKLGVLSLTLVVTYPFMKRITYWPQFFLGLTFNWGALMGWAAVTGGLEWPSIILYIGGIFWTLGYDTIYAHQDKEDDALIGVKSTALKLGKSTPAWLIIFYGITAVLFTIAGGMTGLGLGFYVGIMAATVHLLWQIWSLEMDNTERCLKLFKSNRDFGAIIFASIIAGHYF
ncbi:4-hydroxybenzoate octaprenyltransferase [Emcibacter nanhaiensis]|uniref:4-hydroxybenzoate octaprenyltransferase n=1 Tax=Emcibacter nanhaiensis TaxID=1505037 RepID=A0A501PBV9_9PROT|nr:4-hydroxybenzoate octaprenyltransferase [Emcibacter nanhaiensis]TPD57678.1 4-hydroxybenzoate octaprenyltransferase [Emcibacter nanhaiensis]